MFRMSAIQSPSCALRLGLCKASAVMLMAISVGACGTAQQHFVCVRADRTICRQSAYPLALDKAKVGKYTAETKSGAGYFYDDVLEYRVWFCPERGAKPVNGKDDYYVAFAEYEKAEKLSKASRGAEEPLVLVRQYEWIDEPEPGHYRAQKGNRITGWQVEWLEGSKRTPGSTKDFLNFLRERVSKGTVLTEKDSAPWERRNS